MNKRTQLDFKHRRCADRREKMACVEDAGQPCVDPIAEQPTHRTAAPDSRRHGFWTPAEKLRIVQEARASDLPISIFARSRNLNPSNVYRWMSEAREGKLARNHAQKRKEKISTDDFYGPIAGAPVEQIGQLPSGIIEITFPNGAQIRISPPIDNDVLFQVIAAANVALRRR